jgi:helicase MOV-10
MICSSPAYSRKNPDFLRFCFYEDMVFKCPPLQKLMRYRIIISTDMSSSLLQSEGIPQGHSTHIFLDDAATRGDDSLVRVVQMGHCGCVGRRSDAIRPGYSL